MPGSAKRSLKMLCILMMLVFGASWASSTIDGIQHSGAHPHDHAHVGLSVMSAEIDHDDHVDHQMMSSNQDAPPESGLAHHHHHGDNGSSLAFASAHWAGQATAEDSLSAPVDDRLLAGEPARGLKRPPKTLTTIA